MTMQSIARFAAGFFKVFSYIFTVLEWLWFTILLIPVLKATGILKLFLPNGEQQAVPVAPHETASPMLLIFAAAITAVMILISIIALLRLPKTIAKTGDTVSHTVSEVIVPVITHHKKVPQKKYRLLTDRVMFYVRLGLIIVPLVGILLCPPSKQLGVSLGYLLGSSLALTAVLSLVFEQLLTHYPVKKRVKNKK